MSLQDIADVRGILGMADAKGVPVSAGPFDIQLTVRIGAKGMAAEQVDTAGA
jgi:hypothetical protein